MTKSVREPEMAERAGVSSRTIRYWRSIGLIPYLKVNKLILYDPDAVMKALEKFERVADVK